MAQCYVSPPLQKAIVDRTQQIAKRFSASQGNSFAIIGKGGFPANPEDIISQVNVWDDLRDINIIDKTRKRNIQVTSNFPKPIIEYMKKYLLLIT